MTEHKVFNSYDCGGVSMYYCLECLELHEKRKDSNEMVYPFGLITVDNVKYPLGACNQAAVKLGGSTRT